MEGIQTVDVEGIRDNDNNLFVVDDFHNKLAGREENQK